LLDLPGIIEGAAQGKGRGRQVRKLIFKLNILFHFYAGIVCELMQVIAVARTADLVLMILDATKKDIHKVCFNFREYCSNGATKYCQCRIFLRSTKVHFRQSFGSRSGSIWLRIDLAHLDTDPDSVAVIC
jgi:hypothetical protein